MVIGFSRYFLNSASHWAPTAPSTTRWSQLSVTDIMLATSNLERDKNIIRYSENNHQFLASNQPKCQLQLGKIIFHLLFIWPTGQIPPNAGFLEFIYILPISAFSLQCICNRDRNSESLKYLQPGSKKKYAHPGL